MRARSCSPCLVTAWLLVGCGPAVPTIEDRSCRAVLDVDVMPGLYPNAIDLEGGELAVALLSEGASEPGGFDPGALTLRPAGEGPAVAASRVETGSDVDGDGREDTLAIFSIPELVDEGALSASSSRIVLELRDPGGETRTGCARVRAKGHPAAGLPAPTGPHTVGTLDAHLVDDARKEPFGDRSLPRELMVRAWYPAEPLEGREPAPYFLREMQGDHVAVAYGLPQDLFDFFDAHAVHGAPPIAGERWPLVLLSTGLGAPIELYTGYAEELASHGFVVVGIHHTHASGPVVFPDGRVAGQRLELSPFTPPWTVHDAATAWVDDVRFVLRRLQDDPETLPLLDAHVDATRAVMIGHSFGGATAGTVCQREDDVVACANLDGTMWIDIDEGTSKPMLLLTAAETLDGTQQRFLSASTGPAWHVAVDGTTHSSFSDAPLGRPLFDRESELLDGGSIEPTRAIEVARAYLLAFADEALRGGDGGLLDEERPFSEVSVVRYRR